MEAEDTGREEFRIKIASKKQALEQISKYSELLKTTLDGQTEIPEELKRGLIKELIANFEAAVQSNLLVNGQTFEEAPDDDEEAVNLDSVLEDTIVETTWRRRTYPRKILPYVVHSLKAERKFMGLYEQAVKPQEVVRDPRQENMMTDLSASATEMVGPAVQVRKSINTLLKQAGGLCDVLKMTTSQTTTEIHKEVFGSNSQSALTRNRQPIRRAVEEAEATECYVPPAKRAS